MARGSGALLTAPTAATLAEGLPPAEEWSQLLEPLTRALTAIERPLFHGTSSEFLPSIIEQGLGAVSPENASCPGESYVADGQKKGALTGAYAFALRGAVLAGSGGLTVRAERHGGRSVVERYVAELGLSEGQARLARAGLRMTGTRYALKRGRRSGAPVLLVYEGAGFEDQLVKTKNAAPADWKLSRPLPADRLRLVLAPARSLSSVRLPTTVGLLPLELVELSELVRAGRSASL